MTQCLHQKTGLNGGRTRQNQPKEMRVLGTDLLETTQGLEVPQGAQEEAGRPDQEDAEPSHDRTPTQRTPPDLARAGPRQGREEETMEQTLELVVQP